ncbi:unnamed protein product [Closterium sp. Naga37s-1]|nr:unnamed protein product [Closterium sp. Naga37s-1]
MAVSGMGDGRMPGGDRLFNEAATEEKGERARLSSFVGAMAISDLVKSTLGPKGMDKILQSTSRGGGLMVTNDGATILKALHIDNPAAKVLVDISKVQDDEVGDGTTSVVVLAGELLREAEKLVTARIHPMTIISGYRMALDCAREVLISKSRDNKDDPAKFREDLLRIAKTTLSSKILSQDKEHFASLAVDAVLRLKGSTNLEAIQIIKKAGGALSDSYLDEGFILDKKIGVGQPKKIENAKILVANTAMDTDKVKIYGARVRVDGMAKVAEIEAAEKNKMRQKVEKIIAHGINCFINRQLIYNFPEELFSDAGVMAIEHADFEGIERLALVTGGEIASTFEDPAGVKLGHCKVIEEIMIGEDRLIHFSGVALGEACTIVLRGASSHVLDEAERSLHDALCVLTATVADSRVVWGGGWPEVMMATRVDVLARRTPGKRALAVEAFASALRAIPTIIADNAGLDSAELVAQLRAAHAEENSHAGIDVITGQSGDMEECGIYESLKVKQAVLMSATEAAEMILRHLELSLAEAQLRLAQAEALLRAQGVVPPWGEGNGEAGDGEAEAGEAEEKVDNAKREESAGVKSGRGNEDALQEISGERDEVLALTLLTQEAAVDDSEDGGGGGGGDLQSGRRRGKGGRKVRGKALENYRTRHVALQIMYLGSRYLGFASQGIVGPTVEGRLVSALLHTKLLIPATSPASPQAPTSAAGEALQMTSPQHQQAASPQAPTPAAAPSASAAVVDNSREKECDVTVARGVCCTPLQQEGRRVTVLNGGRTPLGQGGKDVTVSNGRLDAKLQRKQKRAARQRDAASTECGYNEGASAAAWSGAVTKGGVVIMKDIMKDESARYSRCGRTDRGVNAIGQVVALHLRSSVRPRQQRTEMTATDFATATATSADPTASQINLSSDSVGAGLAATDVAREPDDMAKEPHDVAKDTDDVAGEIDYVASLNRALPDDIRVLAWAPATPDFSARWAMQRAAALFKGRHDFRNFCRMDAENVKSFERDMSLCRVVPFATLSSSSSEGDVSPSRAIRSAERPSVWVLQVVGTAFLWHQIRCMMAVLLMVGRGQERPEVVSELLDVHGGPFTSKPQYAPAEPHGLVLHRCSFPASLRFHCSASKSTLALSCMWGHKHKAIFGPSIHALSVAPADPHGLVLHRCSFPASLRFHCSASKTPLPHKGRQRQAPVLPIHPPAAQLSAHPMLSAQCPHYPSPTHPLLAHLPCHQMPSASSVNLSASSSLQHSSDAACPHYPSHTPPPPPPIAPHPPDAKHLFCQSIRQ